MHPPCPHSIIKVVMSAPLAFTSTHPMPQVSHKPTHPASHPGDTRLPNPGPPPPRTKGPSPSRPTCRGARAAASQAPAAASACLAGFSLKPISCSLQTCRAFTHWGPNSPSMACRQSEGQGRDKGKEAGWERARFSYTVATPTCTRDNLRASERPCWMEMGLVNMGLVYLRHAPT